MLFTEAVRQRALPRLGLPEIPRIIEPPQFAPAARARQSWAAAITGRVRRQAAVLAVVALAFATTVTGVSAYAAIQGSSSASASRLQVYSSAGVTGTLDTRVANLSATTLMAHVPFVQQVRYLNVASTGGAEPQRFINGAHQANVVEYIQNVGAQVTLPYANDALTTKQAADIWRWTSAVNQAREERARLQAPVAQPSPSTVWHAPAISGGTAIHGVTNTFYACVGNGFCGNMANGQQVFAGAAACSYDLPMGTQFVINQDPTGRVFTCLDRGALAPTWVDVWFYDAADGYAWQSIVGMNVSITIIN